MATQFETSCQAFTQSGTGIATCNINILESYSCCIVITHHKNPALDTWDSMSVGGVSMIRSNDPIDLDIACVGGAAPTREEMWVLNNPPVGTQAITGAISNPFGVGEIGVAMFSDGSVLTNFSRHRIKVDNSGCSFTSASDTLTTPKVDSIVYGQITVVDNGTTIVDGAGQTQPFGMVFSDRINVKATSQPTTTMSWTWTNSVKYGMQMIGFEDPISREGGFQGVEFTATGLTDDASIGFPGIGGAFFTQGAHGDSYVNFKSLLELEKMLKNARFL